MDNNFDDKLALIDQGSIGEFNTQQKETPFLQELKKIDAEMDRLYKEKMKTIEPEAIRFGFDTIKDGDGSTDFRIRRQAEVMAKYAEYFQRLQTDPRNAFGFKANERSAWYKREVARRTLVDGEVCTWALGRAVEKRFGSINPYRFRKACGVLQNYIEQGGKKVVGGTSLPNFTGKPR